MRILRIFLVILFAACSFALAAQEEETSQVEAAVKETVQSYAEAFNKGDAEALAAHWSKDGDYITVSGEVFTGQDDLKSAFEVFFKDNEGIKIELEPVAIYAQGENEAIEEGFATTTKPGEEPEVTRYFTSYVKEGEDWKIARVKEILPVGTSENSEKLKPLEWMIGDWVDEDESGKLETTCFWSPDGNFIVREFLASVGGQITFGGKQVIGWDPSSDTIRSWVFDTNGGFGEGTWSERDGSWFVKSTLVLNTGEKASSINILTPVDENSFTWQATSRDVGGEILPQTAKVTVVRKSEESAADEADGK